MNQAYLRTINEDLLQGANHCYIVKVEKNKMPDIEEPWNFMMYRLPGRFPETSSIKQHPINSLTIFICKKEGAFTIALYKDPAMNESIDKLPEGFGEIIMTVRLYYITKKSLEEYHLGSLLKDVEIKD